MPYVITAVEPNHASVIFRPYNCSHCIVSLQTQDLSEFRGEHQVRSFSPWKTTIGWY